MSYFEKLKPGKRENAFYLESDINDDEREGLQLETNEMVYIYAWDENKKEYKGKWVKNTHLLVDEKCF